MTTSNHPLLWGLITRTFLFFATALLSSAASADIIVYRNFQDWKAAAGSSGAQIEEIDFFSKETDGITGHHLRPGSYKRLSISGVTFEAVSGQNSTFAINPYADPYAGILYDGAGSTLRITFGQGVGGFFLVAVPSGLGAPSIRISGQTDSYEFGSEMAFVGFVSDKEPIEWIEFTARKRYDLDKVLFYRIKRKP